MKIILFGTFMAILPLSAVNVVNAQTVTSQPVKTQASTSAGQQTKDKWVISAKAGGVNFVEGTVNYSLSDGRYGLLLKGDELKVGDKIITGPDGKAEVLLNPGSYVRMGPNSEFSFETTDLDDLKLNLTKGNAMFEVFASEDFIITVNTPTNKFELIESGIYRIDIEADGDSAVAVWKGRALVNGNADAAVRRGRTGTAEEGSIELAKFDRGDRDALALWSRERAKEITRLNSTLRPRDLTETLTNSFGLRNWDMYNSFGLWVYNPYRGYYTFLPFGAGWSSPYGHWFHYDIWNYRLPRYVYMPAPRPPVNGGGNQGNVPTTPNPGNTGSRQVNNGSSQTKQRPAPANVGTRQQRTSAAPPFVTVQRRGNIDSRPMDINQGARPSTMGPSRPSSGPISVPVRPSAPISTPAPNPTGARRP